MHLGSWIQLYTILHSGTSPDTFQCFPTYNGRPPELVCGRTYPLLGVDPENYGTICLGPDNRSDAARITFKPDPAVDVWEVAPLFGVELWFGRLATMQLMVAPLVFRHHAVFKDLRAPNSAPYVAVDFDTTTHHTTSRDIQWIWATQIRSSDNSSMLKDATPWSRPPPIDYPCRLVRRTNVWFRLARLCWWRPAPSNSLA